MEIHQVVFVQAVVLAASTALWMTVGDYGREEARVKAAGTPVRAQINEGGGAGLGRNSLLSNPGGKSFDINVETRKNQVQLSQGSSPKASR